MKKVFDIAFAGGGVKGIAFIGALDVLNRGNYQIGRLVGTSAGAITAMCLAAGYTPGEMLSVSRERIKGKSCFCSFLDPPTIEDFPSPKREKSETKRALVAAIDEALKAEPIKEALKNQPAAPIILRLVLARLSDPLVDALMRNPLFVRFFALVETGAMFRDKNVIEWIQEQLRNKLFDKEITLGDFALKTKKDLTLVAVDTSDKELLVLNQRTAPRLPVWAAVRMSMSIPFIWEEVAWNKSWGTYRGREKTGNLMVDGGMWSNFPLRLLVSRDQENQEIMGMPPAEPAMPLGLFLDERKPIPGAPTSGNDIDLQMLRRVNRLIETMSAPLDREVTKKYEKDICFIGAKGVSLLEFDMNQQRQELLLNSGRCAMTEYLRKM